MMIGSKKRSDMAYIGSKKRGGMVIGIKKRTDGIFPPTYPGGRAMDMPVRSVLERK
jgi:hypothetical protein